METARCVAAERDIKIGIPIFPVLIRISVTVHGGRRIREISFHRGKADRTLDRRLVNDYTGWFLSVCKRVFRGTFSWRQFNKALRFQKKKQTSADHIFKKAIRLSPVPYSANFLRNEASAFVRMCCNNLRDCSDVLLSDRSSPICYDCFHSWQYNPSGSGT